ncbi:MAG: porin family protein [Candidatus Omnitrophica bacterium]|nr:porin family protein [Candidatus Omnitrophota bacterium]MDD5237291.1 porin family protein [Candidatus Omnitrophota bacterium]MDD5611186.1 porin family protein [Candidatus Omnitrophota bacterium]
MRSKFCGGVILAVVVLLAVGFMAQPARASIIQQPTEEESWAGVYAGLHLGFGWAQAKTRFTPYPSAPAFINAEQTELDPETNGVFAGGQIGINWQRKKLVFGLETDFSGSGISGEEIQSPIIQNNGAPFSATSFWKAREEVNWFGTVRAKLGFAPCSKLLVYGTAGMAYGSVTYSGNTSFVPVGSAQYLVSSTRTKVGWTAGLGAEYALTSKWSVKADYLYYDLGRESIEVNPAPANPPFQMEYRWRTSAHTMNVGLNYKF